MKLIVTGGLLLVTALSPHGAVPSARAQSGERQQAKEAAAPPQEMTIVDEADAPVRVEFLAGWAVPEHKHLVELEFVPRDVSAKPVKAYTVRVHQTWRDAPSGGGGGSMNHTMPYKRAPNAEADRVVFRAYAAGKVKVWVASVEYEDGGIWESKVVDPDEEARRP